MVEELLEALKNKEFTLSCAESLTGGLLSSTICSVSGASKVFKGGVVTYWSEIKNQVINVPQEIIDEYHNSEVKAFRDKVYGISK